MYIWLPILLVISAVFIMGIKFSNKVIYPKTRSHSETYSIETENGKLNKEWFENLPKEEIAIDSPYGYKLYGIFFPVEGLKKTVIICHGITYTLHGSVKYMNMFYKRGYNVLMYDHRNHGRSEGNNTTYGYYEKYDLMAFTDWVLNKCGFDCKVGIHGESLGAAVALQNSAIDPRVTFYVADCPYSDLTAQLSYLLKRDYRLPAFPLLNITGIISRIRAGFSFKQVSPINDLKNVSTPIFFIHGVDDLYILPRMSEDMYKVKNGVKKLYLAPNARHAEAYWNNQEEYDKLVGEFLEQIGM